MANNRIAIRQAIQTLLVGNTDAQANVFTDRKSNLWQSEVPAILINTLVEPALPEGQSAKRYIRDLEIKILVKAQETTGVDDTLDTIVGQVEAIMVDNPGLSGTVLSTIQTHTEIVVDSGGETDIAVVTLTFQSKYIG